MGSQDLRDRGIVRDEPSLISNFAPGSNPGRSRLDDLEARVLIRCGPEQNIRIRSVLCSAGSDSLSRGQ